MSTTTTPVSALPASRWRLFADSVAALLGLNIWVSLVLLPGLFVGAWSSSEELALATAPLLVLGVGLWRRNELVLLLGYPMALLVPLGLAPEMAAAHVYGPVRFSFVALGLVAYLFGASVFTSFREAPPPERVRELGAGGPAGGERWRRRFRIYAELAILSAAFPVALVWAINFDDTAQEYLLQMYPGRAALFTTLMNLGAFAVWLVLFSAYFLGALKPHRTGDHQLRVSLDRLARRSATARVRPIFYLSILLALGLMALLAWYRS